MRHRNETARQQLLTLLRSGPRGTGELARALGMSPVSVYRMLNDELGTSQVVSAGSTRQRKHALRRTLRGAVSAIRTFAVDESGSITALPDIELLQPQGCFAPLDRRIWPEPADEDGWWAGLPYPVYDMRPQGYLGRLIARGVATRLHVSSNPEEWSDDDILAYLVQHGADQSGNLILGEQALQVWSSARTAGNLKIIAAADTAAYYVDLAEQALGSGSAGSSAAGEFPKFTAARDLDGALTPHVIVKFSGAEASAAVRRWSDLLVCEHLALQELSRLPGHCSARSRILVHGGRTFLESERFDRHREWGRSPLVSLTSVDAALLGSNEREWHKTLQSRHGRGLFDSALIARVQELQWFGRFIANTDMHQGNLSFRPSGQRFSLAPAYDMLPMLYAPLRGGELPQARFPLENLPLPTHGREADWHRVREAACSFWRTASADSRISESFRSICAANAREIERWAGAWGARDADDPEVTPGTGHRG